MLFPKILLPMNNYRSIFHRTPLKLGSHKVLQNILRRCYTTPAGVPGSGAGKGGGGGGSVRESGGGLGKYGAAQEESYFYGKEQEKLRRMKKQLKDKQEEPLTPVEK